MRAHESKELLFWLAAAVLVFLGVFVAGRHIFTTHRVVSGCALVGMSGSSSLGQLYRVYICDRGLGVLVPAGRFPREDGPVDDVAI